jgi:nicotinate-nucleotide adenylyltransferase
MHVRRIGILGGTFDPIHIGHIDVGAAAETALGLTRLFVIPANIQPNRPAPNASGFHRFAMAALALSGKPGWRLSDLELRGDGPSYTATTLQQFRDRGCPASDLYFVVGADAFAEIASWRAYPEILDQANFAVVSRPGHPVEDLPKQMPSLAARMRPSSIDAPDSEPSIILIDARTADVSATEIRRRRSEGQPIAGLVAPAVEHHIEQHGLYAPTIPDRRAND